MVTKPKAIARGIKVKTANLLRGKPAEDTKFYTVDFDGFQDKNLTGRLLDATPWVR